MLLNSLPRFLASERVIGNLGADELASRKMEIVLAVLLTVVLLVCCFAVPHFPRRARWCLTVPAGWLCLGVRAQVQRSRRARLANERVSDSDPSSSQQLLLYLWFIKTRALVRNRFVEPPQQAR
jgi:hypothetical protein